IDGTTFDLPDTKANVEAFGKSANAAFPKARLLTLMECGTHAHLAAALGGGVGKGSGERSLVKELMRHLEPGMLLILDAGFYGFDLWRTAQATGAQLLWRLGEGTELATVATLPDGSYTALVFAPRVPRRERTRLAAAARAGEPVPAERARLVRVVEYEVDNRGEKDKKELICLITTLTNHAEHPAPLLAHTYHSRWEHEQGIGQVKTHLRGSGTVLRSKSPQLVRQEIHGYLLTHYALTALMCRAADAAGIEPARVKFARTVRVVRRRVTDPAAFSP
ncbi:MAG: IS4 family transposase, partial [Streptomycetaceae bacterium]|nr:IS4 family transposase [Streptomycetaceae bacterium]